MGLGGGCVANPKRKEKRIEERAPGPPAQSDGTVISVPFSVLLDIKERLGELAKGQEGMNRRIDDTNARIDEVKEVQQSQAQAIQHIAQVQEQTAVENAEAHGDTNAHLSALGATVNAAVDRLDRVEQRMDTLAQAPKGGAPSAGRNEDPITRADKFLEFVKKWGPSLLKAGGAALAALLTWWATVAAKGGNPTP